MDFSNTSEIDRLIENQTQCCEEIVALDRSISPFFGGPTGRLIAQVEDLILGFVLLYSSGNIIHKYPTKLELTPI